MSEPSSLQPVAAVQFDQASVPELLRAAADYIDRTQFIVLAITLDTRPAGLALTLYGEPAGARRHKSTPQSTA